VRRAKVALEAAVAIAKLEEERETEKLEREQRIINHKLLLQQAELDEENYLLNTEGEIQSNGNCNVDSLSTGFLKSTEEKNDWIETGQHMLNQNTIGGELNQNKLLEELTKQFSQSILSGIALATEKHPSDTDWKKFTARQAAGKDLPYFDGKPEEWPTFIASYHRTNELWQFTPEKKLIRLQRCLRGKANETVSSLLNIPDSVDEITKILQNRFGRPEYIIRTLIDKVKKSSSARQDDMEYLMDFSNLISNLVATMKSFN